MTVEKTTANELDTELLEWESVETTTRMKTTYSHGYRAFKNMRERPELPREEHNWTSVEYVLNADCTWSGHWAYKDLKEWEILAGDGSGGIRENDEKWYKLPVFESGELVGFDLYHTPTITFLGTGNEGTEHYWKAEGATHAPGNGQLPARTYFKSVEVHYHNDRSGVWHFLGGDPESRHAPGRPAESEARPN